MSDNPNFIANMSSDEIYFGQDMLTCLTDEVNEKAEINHNHNGVYATVNHNHTGYVSSDDLALLEDVVDTKADISHTHSEYATSTHSHDNYATQTALDTLGTEVEGKADISHTHTEYAVISHIHSEYADADHSHNNYAETTHTHDDYALNTHTHTASEIGAASSTHNHDEDYADINHNHDGAYASISHDHDEDYATIDHTHSNYATITALNEVSASVSGKANASHSHNDTYYTETEVDTKLAEKSDITHTHTGLYDANGSAASALTSANAYTDSKIDALVGEGASTTLDTIGEISSAIEDNQDAVDLLNSAIGTKANATDLNSHTGNTTIHVTETDKNNWNTAKTHADSTHAPANAEANQNAFSNVAVGNTTISANSKTDTLTLVAGSNVTLTPNAEGDSITIASNNTIYAHPTTAGNKHIPAGGSNGQILRWSADGTAVWGNDNNTTYSNATETSSGLMSNTDKTKLDGVAENANNYTLPSAGTGLGGVKTGGDVTISSGIITVNDDSHNHIISNIDGLQNALDGKATSNHNHNDVYYTEAEVDNLLSGKASSSHNHNSSYDAKGSADNALASAKSYADGIKNDLLNGAGTAYDTLKELGDLIDENVDAIDALEVVASGKANAVHTHTIADIANLQSTLNGKASSSHGTHVTYSTTVPVMDGTASVGTASTVARSDHKHPTDTSRASQTSLDSHTSNKSNPHGVTLTQLGVTATAGELNYVDGVTSNIQTQINGKANSSHGTHVTYSTTVPVANGTASVGSASTVARSDHRHPLQTTVSGNAGTATKLATARTISLTGDVTGSTSFDGSGNVSITATVADDSHNHTIANIDNLQTTLDGKASSNHTHTAEALVQMAEALFGTNYQGGVEYSYGSGSGKNVLTEISNMPQGFHTAYAIAGTTGNPETAESYRYFIHKTSTTIGWIWAFGADGSIYSNYLAGANTYKGWKTIHDAKRKPLWTGSYYMTAGHTATPSKKLSQCEHGWMLLWSDYDPDTSTVNNTDFCTTMIPNRNWAGSTWNGAAYYCDIPRYTAGTATDSESRVIKVLNVYDNKLVGTANNNAAPRNDVILRAIYEF